ncbi:hypothetical protein [Novosphingobium gossypii]|uniref:hypothetical protein n=1 Tax=Novosphingobium gossypii TaxID=1604774 RepID=UPI003D1B37D2
MIDLLLLAAAGSLSASKNQPLCIPVASDNLQATTSDIDAHKKLRQALDEPLPDETPMVMLHGKGGHLAEEEYSIVVVRAPDGQWHGTAVGRQRIMIVGAQFTPMTRAAWVLDDASGKRLSEAVSRTCPFDRTRSDETGAVPPPPPLGYISEKIDVVSEKGEQYSFYVSEGGDAIAALIRPGR